MIIFWSINELIAINKWLGKHYTRIILNCVYDRETLLFVSIPNLFKRNNAKNRWRQRWIKIKQNSRFFCCRKSPKFRPEISTFFCCIALSLNSHAAYQMCSLSFCMFLSQSLFEYFRLSNWIDLIKPEQSKISLLIW